MSENFITFNLVDPQKFSLAQLRVEAAIMLNVPLERIQEVKCWVYQLWVKIEGVGGKFISYRCLSIWKQKAIAAIKNCQTQVKLGQFASLIRNEISKFGRYYAPETIREFRLVWKERLDALEAEAEAEAETEARSPQEEIAINWKNGWLAILPYCANLEFLQRSGEEIKRQSQQFLDFPDLLADLRIVWQQQKQKLDLIVS